MKNTIKSLIIALAAALVFASCQKTSEPLGRTISVNPERVEVAGCSEEPATIPYVSTKVTVKAEGDWIAVITDCDWLSVSPNHGRGNAEVTITALNNLDEYAELAGPRSGKVSFCVSDYTFDLEVRQNGEKGLDASRTYKKITKAEDFDSSKGILLVTKNGSSYQVPSVSAKAGPAPSGYSYIYGTEVTVGEDDAIFRPNSSLAYELVPKGEGKYALKQQNGTFLTHSQGRDSFFAYPTAAEAEDWTVEFREDGRALVKNAEGIFAMMLYGTTVEYTGRANAETVNEDYIPYIYQDSKAATDEVISVPEIVTVKGEEVKASIPVTSNKSWKVRCHCERIKSFTESGTGDGVIEVTFDANLDYLTDLRDSILVIGENTNFNVVILHEHFIPELTVAPTEISVAATASEASFDITSNVGWSLILPSGVEADIESGEGSQKVNLSFEPNEGLTEKISKIVVVGADKALETSVLTVVLTQKSAAEKDIPYTETFAEGAGDFTINNVTLPEAVTYVWAHATYKGDSYMKASAYVSGTRYATESWLVSPTINFTAAASASVCADVCAANGKEGCYDDACYVVVTDVDTKATKQFSLGFGTEYGGKYAWIKSKIDLSEYAGKKITVAFVYKSASDNCPTLEVKNVTFDLKYDTIAYINKTGAGTYSVKDAAVYAFGNNNIILGDGTGFILLFLKNSGLAVNDVVNITSPVKNYYGLIEMTNNGSVYPAPTKTGTTTVEYGTPEEFAATQAENYASAEVKTVKYIHATGSQNEYALTLDGTDKLLALQGAESYTGNVEVYGYTAGYNSSKKQITVVITSVVKK